MSLKATIGLLLIVPALAGCFGLGSAPLCELPDGTSGDDFPHATLHTDFGDITLRLRPDEAPLTVANFLAHAAAGTYDNTLFWRMENEFMMQGGDPTNEGQGGETADGEVLVDEPNTLSHDRRGVLSMANRGPDTGRSQFFITFAPAPSLDLVINENEHRGHTIFGEVADGMDVVAGLNYYVAGPQGALPFHNVTLQQISLTCGYDAQPRVNLLTPTVWDIRGTLEGVAAWVRYDGGEPNWALTGLDGTSLPEGWSFSATPLNAVDLPDGWGMALLTLRIPEDTPSEFVKVLLHAGGAVQPIQLRIANEFAAIAWLGDTPTINYGMRLATSTEEIGISQPNIELGVGAPSTIAGFAWGLMGLAQGERAVLHLPAGIAYGYEQEPGPLERFNGEDLDYNVRILSLGGE